MKSTRRQVLWFGADLPAIIEEEMRRRGLSVRQVSEVSSTDLASSCCAIFYFDPNARSRSIGVIDSAPIADMLDQELKVIIHAPDDAVIKTIQYRPSLSGFIGLVELKASLEPYQLAELARVDPGPPSNGELEILGCVPSALEAMLLRRSFHDCVRITLERLPGGRSGAGVFAVYAELAEGLAISHPLPFFAKVDERYRIEQEKLNYESYVTYYVPFSQRPNLDLKRCVSGVEVAIMVGDFVENSVPLSAVLATANRRTVIHSLFDDALKGWRRQAFLELSPTRRSLIGPDELPVSITAEEIRPDIVDVAKSMGSSLNPTELIARLAEVSKLPYRRGPIHGDLNAENVRARYGEAVLIDFYKTTEGPLVADLASLEVAICFREVLARVKEMIEKRLDPDGFVKECLDATDDLYSPRCLLAVPAPHHDPSGFAWLWDTSRQLRLMSYAIEAEGEQYACALAAYLIRTAMFHDDVLPGSHHATILAKAYFLADRIVSSITPRS